jgi:hypothetical protein
MNKFHISIISAITLLILTSCSNSTEVLADYEVTARWADMNLYITKNTPANSPTFASRCLGYLGLAQYESVVHGDSLHQSLAGQLSGLEKLPLPEPNKEYQWILVLNTVQQNLLKSIYIQTSDANKEKIDSLANQIAKPIKNRTSKDVIKRSELFGIQLSEALFEWSTKDGGHRAYLNNFDSTYEHQVFPGSWVPPLFAQSSSHRPLHPYWGSNRTFAPKNKNLEYPNYIPYDTIPGSDYYNQFYDVYKKEQELTKEEKETAIWWSDDPDVTFSPGGHSYFLANTLIRMKKPSLIESTKTLAMVGMSVADAFINCWKWKYHFYSERPNTFIPKFIDQKWESFWPDPPFPAFPSGHAIQASAAAIALMHNFDNQTSFIDRAHEGREKDYVRNTDFVNRNYSSIWEFAEETADSRFYGGIHTPIDNEVGLEQGEVIANNVSNLNWIKN